eukprot:6433295-Amphidinium_carterae.1
MHARDAEVSMIAALRCSLGLSNLTVSEVRHQPRSFALAQQQHHRVAAERRPSVTALDGDSIL